MFRCGGLTARGGQCRSKVKAEGMRCAAHRGQQAAKVAVHPWTLKFLKSHKPSCGLTVMTRSRTGSDLVGTRAPRRSLSNIVILHIDDAMYELDLTEDPGVVVPPLTLLRPGSLTTQFSAGTKLRIFEDEAEGVSVLLSTAEKFCNHVHEWTHKRYYDPPHGGDVAACG